MSPNAPDRLCASRIAEGTGIDTVILEEQMTSTNDVARRLLEQDDLSLPAIVATHCQTAGRGQRERGWLSSEGSLTFSLVQPSTGSDGLLGLVPMTASLAICESIESLHDISPQIKWPNDVMIGDKKTAGILVERIFTPIGDGMLIVGIGVNVNNPRIESLVSRRNQNEERHFRATSLYEIVETETSLTEMLVRIVLGMNSFMNLIENNTDLLLTQISQRNLVIGQHATIEMPGSIEMDCVVKGIGREGQLIVERLSDHMTQHIHSGRILKIWPNDSQSN